MNFVKLVIAVLLLSACAVCDKNVETHEGVNRTDAELKLLSNNCDYLEMEIKGWKKREKRKRFRTTECLKQNEFLVSLILDTSCFEGRSKGYIEVLFGKLSTNTRGGKQGTSSLNYEIYTDLKQFHSLVFIFENNLYSQMRNMKLQRTTAY